MTGALQPPREVLASESGKDSEAVVLLRRARAGDAAALDGLLRRLAGPIGRLLRNVVGPAADVDDLCQEALYDIARGLSSLRETDAFDAWARSVALGRARRWLRTQRRRRWLSFGEVHEADEPLAGVADAESREAVRALFTLLGRCSAEEQLVFTLRYVEGNSLDEVAESVGVSVSTCKRRLRAAEAAVRGGAATHPALARYVTRAKDDGGAA